MFYLLEGLGMVLENGKALEFEHSDVLFAVVGRFSFHLYDPGVFPILTTESFTAGEALSVTEPPTSVFTLSVFSFGI